MSDSASSRPEAFEPKSVTLTTGKHFLSRTVAAVIASRSLGASATSAIVFMPPPNILHDSCSAISLRIEIAVRKVSGKSASK